LSNGKLSSNSAAELSSGFASALRTICDLGACVCDPPGLVATPRLSKTTRWWPKINRASSAGSQSAIVPVRPMTRTRFGPLPGWDRYHWFSSAPTETKH
jgi:hypothetical protein